MKAWCRLDGEKVFKLVEQKTELKKDWEMTQSAFKRLLEWFGEETGTGEQRYLEIHQRLVSYFDRKNCPWPDEMADETLNRVARRLQEEGSITDITSAHYCYILARHVFLESLREPEPEPLDDSSGSGQAVVDPKLIEEQEEKERRLNCLERCLQKIKPDERAIILRYYYGEQRIKIENRKALAAELGISIAELRVVACRIRQRLEPCVSRCIEAEI